MNAIVRFLESIVPARKIARVDLSSTDWTPPAGFRVRRVRIGDEGSGNLKVDAADYGSGVTIDGCQPGETFDLEVTKIYKTGTDVTTITVFG
jgi:hypothetical protein